MGWGGDDEEKGRREKVPRMRGWELCEKGWRLRVSCSLMAVFFRCEGVV